VKIDKEVLGLLFISIILFILVIATLLLWTFDWFYIAFMFFWIGWFSLGLYQIISKKPVKR